MSEHDAQRVDSDLYRGPIIAQATCCYIGGQGEEETRWDCNKPAEWWIEYGPTPDDYTLACTDHVGHLLTDAPEHRVHRF